MPADPIALPQKEKLVALIRAQRYEGNLPHFFSPELFPELEILRSNWQGIRDEILKFEKLNGEIKGLNSNPYVAPQFEGINWSNIFLENFTIRHHKNRKYFPFLSSLIDQIPNCTFVVISILSPHTAIKPHYGDTNGIVRGHLGLIIPESLPACGIRVGDEEREWVEDIVPEFMGVKTIVACTKLLGAQSFNYLENRFSIFKKIPDPFVPVLTSLIALGWRLYLPIQRRIPFL